MAVITPTASVNADSLTWNSNDSLTINNGYTITVNSDQTKFWGGITINNGKLRIENVSTSEVVRFQMGRVSGTVAPAIAPASGLGSIEIAGNWIEIGVGDGTPGQALTVPYRDHVSAVWVETAAGSGVYEAWANCIWKFPNQGGQVDFEGLDGFGVGPKGRVFYQQPDLTPIYHSVQANCTTSTATKNLVVTSTAGIYPGAYLVGSVGITANSVVNRVIDATTLEMNVVGSANSSVSTVTIYNTNRCWLTDQIVVGDGLHGNVIPVGAKVRVPNILITGEQGINIGSAAGGVNINLTNGGSLIADTCLFARVNSTFTTPQTLSLKRCGFSFNHHITKAYSVVMEDVCFSLPPQYPYLSGNRFQYGYATAASGGTSVNQYSYVTGTFKKLTYCYATMAHSLNASPVNGALGFGYADGITVEDLSIVVAQHVATVNGTVSALLALQYVYNSVFTRLELHGFGPIAAYACSGNTIEYINWSAVTRSDFVTPVINNNLPNFLGFDPSTGQDFVDGTPYYFRHQAKQVQLKSQPWQSSKEFTVVPYYSANLGFFNEIAFTPGNNSVVIAWDNRLPTHTAPAFEIYRSTTSGVPVRDAGTRIFTTNTTTTLTYTDSAVSNGTRYYYVLRKYYSAGVFEDSPVWDVTPSATVVLTNYMIQSMTFSDASWVKSGVTVPAAYDVAGVYGTAPLSVGATTRRIQVTATNGTLTKTVSGLTAGSVYTASVWTRFSGSANNGIAAITSTPMRLTWGTTFVDFEVGSDWERHSVTFTATATSHDFVLRFDTLGNWVDLGNCEVCLGDIAYIDLYTTTAAVTTATWEPNKAVAYMSPWGSDHNTGVSLGVPNQVWGGGASMQRFTVSDTPGFVPSDTHEVAFSGSVLTGALSLSTTCSNNRIRHFTQQGKGSFRSPFISLVASGSDNLFEDFVLDFGQANYASTAQAAVSVGTDCNRNTFRNFDIRNSVPNLTNSRPIFTDNSASGSVFENFRLEPSNAYLNVQNNAMILKGCGGGASYASDALATWSLGSTTDGVPTIFTGIYDTHFAEVYHSASTGALNLFFTASTTDSPPYTTTGLAKFSNTGLLYLQQADDSITYTWPHKIYGVSGFRNIAHKVLQANLGTSTDALESVLLKFQIDTGIGYTDWAEATPAALSALIVSASDGFYLKLQLIARQFILYTGKAIDFVVGETIRQQTSGATFVVAAVYPVGTSGTLVIDNVTGTLSTTTTLDLLRDSDSAVKATGITLVNGFATGPSFTSTILGLQIHTTVDQTVMYPSDPITLTITGLPAGADVTFLSAGTETVLANLEDIPGTTADYVYYAASGSVDVTAYKPGYMPGYMRNLPLVAISASLPLTLSPDPSYLG